MKFGKTLKQIFKTVTKHPDIALMNAIVSRDIDGVRTAFARGANVDFEYNSFPATETFVYTPLEFAVFDDAPTEIVKEILSHRPDLDMKRSGKPISDDVLRPVNTFIRKTYPNNLDNIQAMLASNFVQPKEYHFTNFLYAAARDGRRDLVEFLAAHSVASRDILKKEGANCAYVIKDVPMAALLRAKVAELSATASGTAANGRAARQAAPDIAPGP